MFTTRLKLHVTNWKALAKYGMLEVENMPDELYQASTNILS